MSDLPSNGPVIGMPLKAVVIDYTNWEGERRIRTIEPVELVFKLSPWHDEAQWFIIAKDLEKRGGGVRDFAWKNVHSMKPYTETTNE